MYSSDGSEENRQMLNGQRQINCDMEIFKMKINRGDFTKFFKDTKGKKNIFCFGAGKALTEFLEEFENCCLEDDIKYIVDNAKEKQGSSVQYGGRKIQVISTIEMLQKISTDDVILITIDRFSEVIEQLGALDKLENIDCYICYLLRMEQNDFDRDQVMMPKDFFAESEICIPKVIHYCWFGGSKIPEQNQIWMESWRRYCPDYQIVEWNEKNYDISKNIYMRQAYEKKKWAFVSDYARLDIIARYGGIYLDVDVELIKCMDDLLKNDAFCGFESRRYVNFGLGFGAVKNCGIIERLRDDYEERRFVLEDGQLNEIACPVYQTELLVRHGLKRNGEFQKLKEITVYPERVLCGMSPLSYRVTEKLDHTYSIHHFSGSWLSAKELKLKEQLTQSINKWEKI